MNHEFFLREALALARDPAFQPVAGLKESDVRTCQPALPV